MGVAIHPDDLSPDIKKCQESIDTSYTSDEMGSIASNTSSFYNSTNTRLNLSINDIIILHVRNIFPQNSRDDFKGYRH
jgi:hypothetical protein